LNITEQLTRINNVQIVNWLLTRYCNLKCNYCGIIRHPVYEINDRETIRYPSLLHYANNPISPETVINSLREFKSFNPYCFHIFYGGEPFLYTGLSDILKFCNDNNIYYTVITNNTLDMQKRMYEILKDIKYYQGISASVDPIIYSDNPHIQNSDRYKKSVLGLESLKKIKKDKICDDLVAEITLDKYNIDYIYRLAEDLTKHGIFSSLTFIDIKKSPYYDFSNITDKNYLLHKSDELYNKLSELIDAGFLIHMGEELIDRVFDILPDNLDCELEKFNHNLTIDADGSIRLCLRIKGIETPKYNISEYFDKFSEIHKALINDKKNYCKGCCWTCPIMSKLTVDDDFNRNILHIDLED